MAKYNPLLGPGPRSAAADRKAAAAARDARSPRYVTDDGYNPRPAAASDHAKVRELAVSLDSQFSSGSGLKAGYDADTVRKSGRVRTEARNLLYALDGGMASGSQIHALVAAVEAYANYITDNKARLVANGAYHDADTLRAAAALLRLHSVSGVVHPRIGNPHHERRSQWQYNQLAVDYLAEAITNCAKYSAEDDSWVELLLVTVDPERVPTQQQMKDANGQIYPQTYLQARIMSEKARHNFVNATVRSNIPAEHQVIRARVCREAVANGEAAVLAQEILELFDAKFISRASGPMSSWSGLSRYRSDDYDDNGRAKNPDDRGEVRDNGFGGYEGSAGRYGAYIISKNRDGSGFKAKRILFRPHVEHLLPKKLAANSRWHMVELLTEVALRCSRVEGDSEYQVDGRIGNPIKPSGYDSDSVDVTLKVTPALVRELTGTTRKVSKDLCRYIANDLTEMFGEWSDRGAKYAVRSTLAEDAEDLKELVADMDNSFGPKPTDLVGINISPYLLQETYGDHRHPCTKADLMKVAKYIEKHYFTSEKGGFELIEEAMRNEGVWYDSDDDDREGNPAASRFVLLDAGYDEGHHGAHERYTLICTTPQGSGSRTYYNLLGFGPGVSGHGELTASDFNALKAEGFRSLGKRIKVEALPSNHRHLAERFMADC